MTKPTKDEYQRAKSFFGHVLEYAKANLMGRDKELRAVLVALVARGHILLEGVPGVAKTQLLKDMATVLGLDFSRAQFTPDKLPTDLTGWYNKDSIFVPGPFYLENGGLVLGDEINRASPKTQAAVLEVMEEKQITLDNKTFDIVGPYMVMATQNPLEHDGTYPLPAAQLDRFTMKLKVDRISRTDLKNAGKINNNGRNQLQTVDTEALQAHIDLRPTVVIDDKLDDLIIDVLEKIREHSDVKHGPWERGYFGWRRVGQACALLNGDGVAEPAHMREFAPEVLRHRTLLVDDEHLDEEGQEKVEYIIDDALSVLR